MADIEFIDKPSEPIEFLDVDGDSASPHGVPCENCGAPVESADRFCVACGRANGACQSPPPSPASTGAASTSPASTSPASTGAGSTVEDEVLDQQKLIQCKNCGAEIATDPNQRSYVCPFCDSTYVMEIARDQTNRQRPEFVIGFSVNAEQAREKFRKWIGSNSWFRPGDLKTASVEDKQRGVYLPFWSFSMLAQSGWSANIGEYWYRTETYTTTDANGKTVTRTRQVRETEWWPLQGRHHHYYSGYLVSGSKGLNQRDAERIKPFNLPALRRYEPHYLAGWEAEEYSVDREQALQLCQKEFYAREQRNVGRFMPGDTHRGLRVNTSFHNINSDLCLLPVYVLSYKYQNKLYRFLVNGQTGKVAGDKPWSWTRIWIFIGVIVAILVALGLFAGFSGAF